jgi:hypothetical protein
MDGLLIFGKEEPMEKGEFILGMVAYILVTSKMGGESFGFVMIFSLLSN